METTKFKTTIKCSGCLTKVTPVLNAALGENNWQVDYTNPAKILTVQGKDVITKVIEAVEKAGFKAEKL